ncbi:efflux transporter outer membrane subunit [Chitinimonas sp.]|uniref:efflux transporter outer membrane subunit n=1 Tax=Chitinimonas sp. TaxID=1934313 RepID=UPI002F951619
MPAVPRLSAALLPAALASLMTACSSLQPPAVQPDAGIAPHYPEQAATGADPIAASQLSWERYFTDPALQGLISQALANNRELRVSELQLAIARAAYGIQGAEQWPVIAAQAKEDRSRVPADLNLTRRPLLGSQYQVGLGMASWELDFWGRVRSLKEAALARYLASEAASRAARLSLINQVAQAYFGLLELDERLALAEATLDSRNESLRIFRRREAMGATSRLNLTQVETLQTQAQALVAQLQQARASQLNALTVLVGSAPRLPEHLPRLDEQATLANLAAGLPGALLSNRPDLLAAEQQLKAAHAEIGAARAAFFPRIALTAAYGSASAELDGLFKSGSEAWSFSPSLTLPLFDAGRRQDNLDLATARRDQAVAQYERAVQLAFRDVADALAARRWLAEQLGTAERALAVQAERARLSQLRYDSGAVAYLEVLDAQRDLLQAQQQLVQSRRALLASRASLYAALGGGSALTTPTSQP